MTALDLQWRERAPFTRHGAVSGWDNKKWAQGRTSDLIVTMGDALSFWGTLHRSPIGGNTRTQVFPLSTHVCKRYFSAVGFDDFAEGFDDFAGGLAGAGAAESLSTEISSTSKMRVEFGSMDLLPFSP